MNGVDSRKEIGQGLQEFCHKQKPSEIDVLFGARLKQWLQWLHSLPLPQLSRDTCACGQLPEKSTVPLSTQFLWDVLSRRKERAGSWNNEEGLGSVTGLMNLSRKNTETLWGSEQWDGSLGSG